MQVGFNLPVYLDRDGHWLGPFPHVDPRDRSQLNPLWAESLPRNLARLARMKVSVLRVFIMGNCFNYGPAPVLTRSIGDGLVGSSVGLKERWQFNQPEYLDDDRSYRGDPDGQLRRFDKHFTLLLQQCKTFGIKLLPSIIDFEAFLDPLPSARGANLASRAGGRGDVIEDSAKRKRFFDHVLSKFLSLAAPFREHVFAFELMNEPIQNSRAIKVAAPAIGNRIISESAMFEFLRQGCELIESAGFHSTVGHRYYVDCTKFPTGTLAQYHYYPPSGYARPSVRNLQHAAMASGLVASDAVVADVDRYIERAVYNDDPMEIPTRAAALKEIPDAQTRLRPGWTRKVEDVFIGEFGSAVDLGSGGTTAGAWPELNGLDRYPATVLPTRLKLLANKGYGLALPWPHLDASDFKWPLDDKPDNGKILRPYTDDLTCKMDESRWQSICAFTGATYR
jgi:hypothetical protein